MKSTELKISLFLASICFISGFFLVPHQFETLQSTMPEQFEEMISTIPLPMGFMLIVASLQLFVVSFILSFIGIKLAKKTGFSLSILYSLFNREKITIDKKPVILSIVSGMVVALVIVGADRFYYQYQIPMIRELEPEFSFLGLVAGVLYGGVFEEIMLRLFFMSLIIWIFIKIFRLAVENISNKFYWVAIIISSLLFAIGHLPATEMLFGELTTILFVRSLILNGVGGLLFGYLYWKKGLEYAILAHMFTHISLQLIFIPLLY